MKKIFKYGVLALTLLAAVSCESWLDVKPADREPAGKLFSSREGFVKALNGVYVELNDRNIYGRDMQTLLDLMAQYYRRTSAFDSPYSSIGQYNYSSDLAKAEFQAIWERTYFLITNLNVIIDECGTQNPALPGIWHGLVKGEALALRAFLHLDMLRLFGPIYANDPAAISIPYVTNSDQSVSPLLTAEQAGKRIIADLTEAIALLAGSDPIVEGGRMNSAAANGDNSLRFRQYRMNYYAARAVLARAYMWVGDHENAYKTSTALLTDVLTPGSEVFPFTTTADALDGTLPDRVFSTEAMFALYDNSITQGIFNYAFAPTLHESAILRMYYTDNGGMYTGRISQLYSNQDDYRYRVWFSTYQAGGAAAVHYFRKFETPVATDNRQNSPQQVKLRTFRYMHPLVRISEVLLIASESCWEHKQDLGEAKGYLSRLRAARGIADLVSDNEAQLRNNLEWEFRREMLGEGQMFFYYKRRAAAALPAGSMNAFTGTIAMPLVNYVVPLPDSEINERDMTVYEDDNE